MYPMLCDGVVFLTKKEKGSPRQFYVKTADGTTFRVTHGVFNALRHADGTKPLRLPDHGKSLLPELKRCGLVRTSRLVKGGLLNRLTLFPVGDRAKKMRQLCRTINDELTSICFAVIMITIFVFTSRRRHLEIEMDDFNIWLCWGLFFLSVLIHELGHMAAGISYGGYHIKEVGLLFFLVVPIGAYVAYDKKTRCVKNEELQFTLAGIEANLVLAGIFLVGAAMCEPQATNFFEVGVANILLVVGNLVPTEIIEDDGAAALNTLFEVEDIFELAREGLGNRRRRRKLVRSGLPGIACLVLFGFVLGARFIYYTAIMIINVLPLFL